MRPMPFRLWLLALVLAFVAVPARAGDLWVFVFRGDDPAENLQVTLDSDAAITTGLSGLARFDDLGAGTHQVVIREGGNDLHGFRFASAAGQNADVIVRLPDGDGDVQVDVETYATREARAERGDAPAGRLVGSVTSAGTGNPVADAQITVDGEEFTTRTDLSGNFELELPRGIYRLTVSHPGYAAKTSGQIRVVGSLEQQARLTLSRQDVEAVAAVPDAQDEIEEVVVVGRYVADTAAVRERDALAVTDFIDIEQLARFGDSDVAAALGRTVGVTIQEDKFVFVRGLGGRYTTTSLNGTSLASTDPTRRTVPLDLFPASMLERISIQKAFTPDLPGDSTGAHVKLVTKSYPAEPVREISFGISGGSRVTGKTLVTDPTSGDLDFLGYDDGERALPLLVQGVQAFNDSDLPLPPPPDSLVELAGESFSNQLTPVGDDTDPGYSLGVTLGDSFGIGDTEFGYLAVLDYSNNWSAQENGFGSTFRREAEGLVQNTTSDFEKATNTVDINGLLSLGAEFGRNNELRLVTMVNRSTFTSVRRDEGLNEGADLQFAEDQIEWTERTLITQGVSGNHFFPNAGDLELDWNLSYAFGDRYSPDRRAVLFQEQREGRGLELEPERGNTERRFEELEDENLEFNTSALYRLEFGDTLSGAVKAGGGVIRKEREFDVERFGFRLRGNDRDVLLGDRNSAEQILSAENIGPLFVLEDRTEPRDNFDADWDIDWVYAMGTLESERFQFNAGVRVEESDQTLDTFQEITGQPETVKLKQTDTLPAASATWFMNSQMQLRFAYSETVARPDFKELSNARFVDPLFNFVVQGNSNLQISSVTNFDLRWEWFFNDQDNLTVGIFYKEIDDPIELVFRNISSSAEPDRIFRNQTSAELSGIEVDFRKEFALDAGYTQSLFLGLNASLIDSEVELEPETAVSEGQTRRALQDQAESTLNVQVGYDHLGLGHQVTLLYNRVGDRISEGGGGGLPEVIEVPFDSLDLVYEYSGLQDFVLRAKIRNILDDSLVFTQGGETFRELEQGVGFSFSVKWKF